MEDHPAVDSLPRALDRALLLTITVSALALIASACCPGGDEYITFGIGSGAGYTTPLWGRR